MKFLQTRRLTPALLCLLFFASTLVANAATYYVAPYGSTAGNGSETAPWPTVAYALSKVRGGHTIMVAPGTYSTIQIPLLAQGTATRPTIIKSQVRWGAVVAGSSSHGIYTGDNTHYVVIDGFQVMNSRGDGIKLNGNYSTVRDCWVHHSVRQGISSHNKTGTLLEKNLVEYNGTDTQQEHGIYISGNQLTVRSNIIRANAGYGLHMWSSVSNTQVYNNVIYDHRTKGGIVFGSGGSGNNYILNNTVVNNIQAIRFYSPVREYVVNNIMSANTGINIFDCFGDVSKVYMNYNLTFGGNATRTTQLRGPNGLTTDPRFVDAAGGNFLLTPQSPALGRASRNYVPPIDFWFRSMQLTSSPALGAYQYVTDYSLYMPPQG